MGKVDESILLDLVGRIYEAASDPDQWPGFMETFSQPMDAEGAALWLHDLADGSSNLSIMGSRHRGPLSDCNLALYLLLVPHIQRAFSLHHRLARARLPGQAALSSLDLQPTAVWLLGSSGELLHANPAAERLTLRGDVITQSIDGRPQARVNSINMHLQRLIASALRTGLGQGIETGGAYKIWGNNGSRMLHVIVTPLKPSLNKLGAVCAAVFATDPNSLPEDLEGNLRRLYGLTPCEAKLAAALIAGETVQEYSERLDISEATARTHLKGTFAKTDTRRQSDLMRVILTGPAMLVRVSG